MFVNKKQFLIFVRRQLKSIIHQLVSISFSLNCPPCWYKLSTLLIIMFLLQQLESITFNNYNQFLFSLNCPHCWYKIVYIVDYYVSYDNYYQFDCVPPVVNVAHRNRLGHLSAMLGHELQHELGLNLRYNRLYTFFKRTRHQFLLLARDVIMSGQLTP